MHRKITRLAFAVGKRYAGRLPKAISSASKRLFKAALPRLKPEPARKVRRLICEDVMFVLSANVGFSEIQDGPGNGCPLLLVSGFWCGKQLFEGFTLKTVGLAGNRLTKGEGKSRVS